MAGEIVDNLEVGPLLSPAADPSATIADGEYVAYVYFSVLNGLPVALGPTADAAVLSATEYGCLASLW